MFCTDCGAKNAADSKFCKQCGVSVEKARIREEDYTNALPAEEQSLELLESAYALRKKGDAAGAVLMCERALQIAPDSAAGHSLLGQLYAGQGDRERAIREYERVLKLNPGSIADRVKLDELRDEGLPKAKAMPLIAAGKENKTPNFMMAVSVCAAIIALTAAGAALTRKPASENAGRMADNRITNNRATGNNPASGAGANETAAPGNNAVSAPSAPDANGDTGGISTQNETAKNNLPAIASASATIPGSSVSPSAPTNQKTPNPPVTNPTTPNVGLPIIHAPSAPFRTSAPSGASLPILNPMPARPADRPNGKKPAAKKAKAEPGKDDRIVLDNSDGKAGDSEHYTIRINAGDRENTSTGGPKNRVVVSNNGGETAHAPAADSRSAISIADDLRYKGEFDKAVRMYQRALPGAGDRAAHVYHQMAYCFQAKGDKSSAKVNYERAIEAYQKIAASGHEVESAQSAIRVCLRGIKICE